MVVLISGVSLAGYAALRLIGSRYGAAAVGCIGGLVSSTATTLLFARHARKDAGLTPTAMAVILLANLTMIPRLGALVAVLAPGLLKLLAIALVPGVVLGLMSTFLLLRRLKKVAELPLPDVRNPTEIRAALGFGALYAVVLFFTAWLSHYAGDSGLYVSRRWCLASPMSMRSRSPACACMRWRTCNPTPWLRQSHWRCFPISRSNSRSR